MFVWQRSKDIIRAPLKGSRFIPKAKWHSNVFIMNAFDGEWNSKYWFWVHFYLVNSLCQINSCRIFTFCQFIKDFAHVWYWISFGNSYFIEFSIIHYYFIFNFSRSISFFYFWIRLSGSPLNYIMSFTCRRASARLLSFSATVCGNKWLWHCYCRFLIFIVLENILFF